MFVDETRVVLKAGDGGDGCLSFRREKYIPKGGPNGGDGGRGGDVILVCDGNVADLTAYRFQPNWTARNGGPGRGQERHGKNGESVELRVPPGTVVYKDDEEGAFVTELTEHEQTICLLNGGKGGFGNIHFKSSTNQAPRQFTPGKPGEEGRFRLVLKTIADVGLIGFPNAGKSSLLTLVTNAHPKTAPYPFTTLHPCVGILDYPDDFTTLTLADIPGLIEGASENRGLGHRFLKHIERCRVLLILLDMAGTDNRKPEEDYTHLLEEIGLYQRNLLERPRLLVANKLDEPTAEENLTRFQEQHPDLDIIPISILAETGIPELRKALLSAVLQTRQANTP